MREGEDGEESEIETGREREREREKRERTRLDSLHFLSTHGAVARPAPCWTGKADRV